MPFSYRDLICGGKTFCYCLPVRMGVIAMSVLGMLVAGLLSIVLWFEVSADLGMTVGGRASFVVAAIVETVLFVASILGFVGAVVRKQSFIQTYAYILYVHFLCNIAAAAYLGHTIISFQKNITLQACEQTVTDPDAKAQCQGLLRVTATVYVIVACIVLFIELYGAIIVTRHLNLVKRDKRSKKDARNNLDNAFRLKTRSHVYTPVDLEQAPLNQEEFNPYADVQEPQRHSRNNSDLARQMTDVADLARPALPIEAGYGGGSWTHSDISQDEKARLQRERALSGEDEEDNITEEQKAQRRSEQKSLHGPTQPQADIDPLPQYTPVPHQP